MEEAELQLPRALDVLVFVVELVLFAVLAWAGARLGSPTLVAVLLTVALPVIAALVWGRWLAPRASRRLDNPTRLVVKLALLAVAATLLALSGVIALAVALLVVGVVIVWLGEAGTSSRR
ncbi:YrdB family protein [Cellulosimicrobium terreum]|nr:YrdB family protein [Cellulosimicrobium terreum]